MNCVVGITGLQQLEKRYHNGLVENMIYKSNVIGNEWIEVILKSGHTYEVVISIPGAFYIDLDKYVDTVTDAKFCLFIAEILKYKKDVIQS